MDEKSLLKRLQNRDEKVFEEIIDRYNAYVTTIVRSLLSSRGTKEDIRWSDWNKQGGCFAVTGRNQYR